MPRTPHVQSSALLNFTTTNEASTLITIPAGKIFVLEFVSFTGLLAPGVTVQSLAITVTGNLVQGEQGSAKYELLIPPLGVSDSQVMRLYAQPGTNLEIDGTVSTISPTTLSQVIVSLSGYFVNAQ